MEDAEIRALAAQVAVHLDGDWVPANEDNPAGAMLASGEMRRLFIRSEWQNPGRLKISGEYPRALAEEGLIEPHPDLEGHPGVYQLTAAGRQALRVPD